MNEVVRKGTGVGTEAGTGVTKEVGAVVGREVGVEIGTEVAVGTVIGVWVLASRSDDPTASHAIPDTIARTKIRASAANGRMVLPYPWSASAAPARIGDTLNLVAVGGVPGHPDF